MRSSYGACLCDRKVKARERRNGEYLRTRSIEVRLDESWTGVDVDLPQDRVARVHKSMRRICRDHRDRARFDFARLVADR